MSFITPNLGFVAAAVGLPILLTFYFLKLRRRPLRISSTLLWKQATRDLEVNAPFRMIRPSWLLLLHLLLLALLCLAIARPTLDAPRESAGAIVFLIDRSASMSARDTGDPDANTSRLDQAKARALDLLSRLDDRVQVSVVAFASDPTILAPLTPDLGQAARAIQSIAPSDQPGDLLRALRLVEAMTSPTGGESADNAMVPRVVIISDGEPPTPGADTRPLALDASAIEFLPVPEPRSQPRANIAIVSADAARDADEIGTVRLFCRVQAVNPTAREIALTLRLDGRPVASRPLTLAPSPDDASVWEGTLTFEFSDEAKGGLATVSHAIDDALESDDTFALRLNPPLGPRILLVQNAMPEDAIDYVLADALAVPSLRVQSLETITIAQYERRLPDNAPLGAPVRVRLESGDLPDLVLFDACAPTLPPACPSVSFGASLPIRGLNLSAPSDSPSRVAFFRRTHPLLRYADLGDLRIDRSRTLTLPEPGATLSRTEVLAEGADGPLIVELTDAGYTRVIVAFALGESAWWRRPGFPRFIKNALDTLTDTGVENTATSHTTTEPIPLAPADGATTVRIRGPIERTVRVENASSPTSVVLPSAGVYALTNAEPAQLPVNLASPAESRIRTSATLELPSLKIDAGNASNVVPREIWPWLVMAAAVLLTLEWALFAWKMRA